MPVLASAETLLHSRSELLLHSDGEVAKPLLCGSSSASTRTPSPHSRRLGSPAARSSRGANLGRFIPVAEYLSAADQGFAQRALQAERALADRDQRIEALEARVREMSTGAGERFDRPERQGVRLGEEEEETDIVAEMDEVCAKTEQLLQKLAKFYDAEEPERQWAALMAEREDCKGRLSQIEALVQRRVDQLPAGHAELRVCRAVRGLCVGSQKVVPRRWTLTD